MPAEEAAFDLTSSADATAPTQTIAESPTIFLVSRFIGSLQAMQSRVSFSAVPAPAFES
jgi:hypothetical protein